MYIKISGYSEDLFYSWGDPGNERTMHVDIEVALAGYESWVDDELESQFYQDLKRLLQRVVGRPAGKFKIDSRILD